MLMSALTPGTYFSLEIGSFGYSPMVGFRGPLSSSLHFLSGLLRDVVVILVATLNVPLSRVGTVLLWHLHPVCAPRSED